MNNYLNIKPFRFWCQKVLPVVYDDSLSYYELLCKVVDYLNKVIENCNALIDNFEELYKLFLQLKDYVDDYFNNLDLTDEINNKLDEMAEDGTLEALVNSAFNLTPQGTTIDLMPLCALKLNRGLYNSGDDLNGKCYSITQGGCYAKYNNKDLYLCFTNPALKGSTPVSNGYRLELIDFTPTLYSGEPTPKNVKTFVNNNGSTHGNSIAFDGNYFYYPTDNNTGVTRIDVDLTTEEKLSINLEDIGVNLIGSIAYYNGVFWIGDSYKIGKFTLSDTQFNFENKIVNIEQLEYGTTQSLSANKYGFARVVSFPNAIVYHDINGKIKRIYNIPTFVNGGTYYTGYETEDLTIDDDFNVYLHTQGFECNSAMESFVRVFKTNLLKNQYSGEFQSTTLTGSYNHEVSLAPPTMTQNVYVSNAVVGNGVNSITGDIDTSVEVEYYLNKKLEYSGTNSYSYENYYAMGSYHNPYGFLQTALNTANSPNVSGCKITLQNFNDKPFGFVNFINCKNLQLTGSKDKLAQHLPVIFDTNIYYASNITIDHIRFEMNNTAKPRYLIGCYFSSEINLVNNEYTLSPYFDGMPNLIYSSWSEINLGGTGIDDIQKWTSNTPINATTGTILRGFEHDIIPINNGGRNVQLGTRAFYSINDEYIGTETFDLTAVGWDNPTLIKNMLNSSKKMYISLSNSILLPVVAYSSSISTGTFTRTINYGGYNYIFTINANDLTLTCTRPDDAPLYLKHFYTES